MGKGIYERRNKKVTSGRLKIASADNAISYISADGALVSAHNAISYISVLVFVSADGVACYILADGVRGTVTIFFLKESKYRQTVADGFVFRPMGFLFQLIVLLADGKFDGVKIASTD